MSSERLVVKAGKVITPLQILRDAVIVTADENIEAVGLAVNTSIPEGSRVIDVGDRLVVPGFLDIHHHGALGAYAAQDSAAVKKIAQYLVTTGTTGWLPTVNSTQGVSAVTTSKSEGTGAADVLGVHMEGPFLAPKRVPGQEAMDRHLREPSLELLDEFLGAANGTLKIMGVAPELPGALDLIRELRQSGVVPAIAHTKTSYEQFMAAVQAGARHVTHAYNVMTGFHHRRPGVVGGVLTCDQVTAELIADSFHVSPPAMDVLIRCKGIDRVAVITDSTPLAGLPDGTHEMFGRKVIKQDGISRIAGTTPDQDNTMAGSEWPLNGNIRNLVELVGVPLRDAIRMATLTPAKIIGLEGSKGSLEPGKDADLVVIDEQLTVYLTMVRGRVVYERSPGQAG
ncbi:MAG: N-acetylglucosamine-6-phosphate deacetylase [Anaerolineales bacterium]|nr:MAG: N-acetylglucosamine-6-phosphate deacetylase [Anaerolineales bacterium]